MGCIVVAVQRLEGAAAGLLWACGTCWAPDPSLRRTHVTVLVAAQLLHPDAPSSFPAWKLKEPKDKKGSLF